MSFFYKREAVKSGRTIFPKVVVKDLGLFPVPEILVKAGSSDLTAKAEQMLDAKKELAKAKTDKDKNYYGNKCAALDRQIDVLVYKLYGLADKEISVVEGSAKNDGSRLEGVAVQE